jgi:pyroglutamyl-peptidase
MNASRRHPRPVLLAGFGPFADARSNPSIEAARALDGSSIAGHQIVVRELPVEFGVSRDILRRALRDLHPALVLCTGLAASRSVVSLERVAINLDDARIPDNAGRQPVDVPVVRGGPDAYFSTLPLKAMFAALREAGIPAEVSQSAGTYVCNHVFYALMHRLRRRRGVRGGFVHLPPPSGQFTLPVLERALRICLETALSTTTDARIAAGATD